MFEYIHIHIQTLYISFALGTDIVTDQNAVISCYNQSHCITPQLMLEKTFAVYFCKWVANGIRFWWLVRDAVLLHPRVRLVEDPAAADIVSCRLFLYTGVLYHTLRIKRSISYTIEISNKLVTFLILLFFYAFYCISYLHTSCFL